MKAKKKKPAKQSAKNKKSLSKKVTKKLTKKKAVPTKKKIVAIKKKKKKAINKATTPKAKSQKKVSVVQKQGNKKHIPKPRVYRKSQLVFKTESIKPIKQKNIVPLETVEVISELPEIEEEIVVENLDELQLDDHFERNVAENVKDVKPPLPLE